MRERLFGHAAFLDVPNLGEVDSAAPAAGSTAGTGHKTLVNKAPDVYHRSDEQSNNHQILDHRKKSIVYFQTTNGVK